MTVPETSFPPKQFGTSAYLEPVLCILTSKELSLGHEICQEGHQHFAGPEPRTSYIMGSGGPTSPTKTWPPFIKKKKNFLT